MMADVGAAERALAGATQLEKIGFVEFTSTLVSNVFETIVDSALKQLDAYADFVGQIADTLEKYQEAAIGVDGSAAQTTTADSYIETVLALSVPPNPTGTEQIALTPAEEQTLKNHFAGVTFGPSGGPTQTIDDVLTGSTGSITLSTLREVVIAMLKANTKKSYDLLKAVLQIGMQKVVVSNGTIETKLTFHVDAQDSYSKTVTDTSTRASNWSIGGTFHGSGSGTFRRVISLSAALGISGGYAATKLNVHVVNERSTAATNIAIDILGAVKINFNTETFPTPAF
jgi:hypothetical protein